MEQALMPVPFQSNDNLKKTPSLSWMPPVSLSSPCSKQTPSQIKASKVELEEHYIPILGDIFLSLKPILPSFLDLLL